MWPADVMSVVLACGARGLGLGLGLGSGSGLGLALLRLDVAGRRHQRGLGARGQQRLDAAERAALVLELAFG